MDDKTANTSVPTQQASSAEKTTSVQSSGSSTEARQAYGTAKTENLRDSGLWRVILPGFVILCCLALLIIPLAILIPLLITSLQPGSPSNAASLTWLWIIMIIVVLGAAVIAIRGFLRIFMTQAQNYSS
jgi:magnesium-transporting ATPase (P-type)